MTVSFGPFQVVRLTCKAEVGGERVTVQQVVAAEVWADPEARKVISESLRQQLALDIVKRWKPKIYEQR